MAVLGSRRWWALGAVSLAVLAVGLDGTVLSVALPTLSGALHASESDLQWFSSGYLLILAAAMLPAGLLGDRFGRKKLLLLSAVLFAVSSILTGWAYSFTAFIAWRMSGGVAIGIASNVSPTYIAEVSPAPWRGRLALPKRV